MLVRDTEGMLRTEEVEASNTDLLPPVGLIVREVRLCYWDSTLATSDDREDPFAGVVSAAA